MQGLKSCWRSLENSEESDLGRTIVKEALSIFKEAHSPSLWYSYPENTKEERAIKAEKGKKQLLKSTQANSRQPKSMLELQKMLDAQKTLSNTYQDE